MTFTINWPRIGKALVGSFKLGAILYALILANYSLHLAQQNLSLQLSFDRALIEVLQAKAEEENSDGPDPNPPTHSDRTSL